MLAVGAVHSHDNKQQKPWQRINFDSSKRNASSKQTCRNCGRSYPYAGGRESCPAFGKNCRACSKPNHFATCCRSKKQQKDKPSQNQTTTTYRPRQKNIREVHDETADNTSSDNSNDYALTISNKMKDKQPRTKIKINGVYFSFLIDTGASINLIDEEMFNKFKTKPVLKNVLMKIFAYEANTPVVIIGLFRTEIE